MDFVGNNNPTPVYETLRRLDAELPDYCNRDIYAHDDIDQLSSVAFADRNRRELPIHEKAATWLSAVYFYSGASGEKSASIESNIQSASKVHGIQSDVEAIKKAFTETVNKQASETPRIKYALAVDFGEGLQEFYPLNGVGAVFGSAEQIATDMQDTERLMPKFARIACVNLVKEAKRLLLPLDELPTSVVATGREALPDFEHAQVVASLRKQASDDDRVSIYQDLVEFAKQAYEENNSEAALEPALEAWELLDKELNIKYSRRQINPYAAFFTGPSFDEIDKAAANVVLVEEVMIPKVVFDNLSDKAIEREFAGDTAVLLKQARDLSKKGNPRHAEKVLEEATSKEARQELLNVLVKEIV